ncbi:DUF1592 domain-containing protein [Horticoccus sp. 23ND18S-11]|uniref:DUF1592 domain-containing protein n=1 Tax=Horticoccus sp. 23ND18S-11 TaxID=3391832 RepID=UPI0039C925A1
MAALAFALLTAVAPAADAPAQTLFFQFADKYCLKCHDAVTQKGDREFESFTFPLKNEAALIAAKDIVDQITLGEMPPPKAKERPTDDERLAVLRVLRESIAAARGKIESTAARTVMRRLSNREYENTLATLFGRRVDTLGLTADFPKEKASEHIDTIGKSLVTSGFLLDQYFQSANRLVETRLGRPDTPPQSWHFKGNFVQYEELSGPHKAAFDYKYLCLYEQPNTDTRQGGYGHIEDFLKGVPVSGLYDIEVHAQAMHRDTHYDPAIFGIDFAEPFLLGVVPGDATKNHIHYPQAIEPLLAQATVADEKPEWIKFRIWLEAGQTPRFIFPNGPYESRAAVLQVNKRYKDDFQGRFANAGVSRTHLLREGKLPHIRIGEIKIAGPVTETGGSAEEIAVFGARGFQPKQALDQLYAFGARAYRRPLTSADRASIRKTYETRIADKATPRQAALDTVKMMLCSPSFLYLAEVVAEKETKLGAYDLASRLSYALWGAPPDQELLAAAGSGKLTKPQELSRQSARLLADERVAGFVSGFLDSWLNLRELGGMPPPRESTRVYYAENLPEAMKTEVRLFFRHLLRENGSVQQFLDADYTFADKRLAKLYNLPEQKTLRLADGFQRVSFNGNRERGGLLGMAGVLAVSANGVETSPVTRGVWVSENILGIKPPPPPDVVPALGADVTGATTVRERLAKHRADQACNECHRKIDALGFGLENFDPIGRWRTTYPKPKGNAPAPKVDSTGEFGSGETYAGFPEFKGILTASRKDGFTRHLIKQFLSYATGRHMEPVDEFVIEDIFQAVKKEGYGLRTLVAECLASDIFRSR